MPTELPDSRLEGKKKNSQSKENPNATKKKKKN